MWSFSLFLSSFKMLFSWNHHHLHQRLAQSYKLQIFHRDLELQIHFQWHPGFLLWILHKRFNSSSSPFVLCLGKTVFSMSLFQPFLSLVPPPLSHSDYLTNHIPWSVFLRYVSHCHFPGAGWVYHCQYSHPVRTLALTFLQVFSTLRLTGWSLFLLHQLIISLLPITGPLELWYRHNPTLSPGPLLTSCRGDVTSAWRRAVSHFASGCLIILFYPSESWSD